MAVTPEGDYISLETYKAQDKKNKEKLRKISPVEILKQVKERYQHFVDKLSEKEVDWYHIIGYREESECMACKYDSAFKGGCSHCPLQALTPIEGNYYCIEPHGIFEDAVDCKNQQVAIKSAKEIVRICIKGITNPSLIELGWNKVMRRRISVEHELCSAKADLNVLKKHEKESCIKDDTQGLHCFLRLTERIDTLKWMLGEKALDKVDWKPKDKEGEKSVKVSK